MRRALSITIVLLFGFSLAGPLFYGAAASNLPACCRRAGLHHCANTTLPDPGTRTISTVAPKCPNCPKATPAPRRDNLTSPQAQAVSTPLYAHPASLPQIEARYRVAFSRSRQKRGPPATSLAS